MFVFNISRTKIIFVFSILIIWGIFCGTRTVLVNRADMAIPLEKVETDQKVIALTFNVDWGEEYIIPILDVLETKKVEATFFVTGKWAEKNSELVKTIAEQGHEVENHGYSHSHPDRDSLEKTKDEIIRTENIINNIINRKTVFFAPPYGERGTNGLKAAQELNYEYVLWTLDTIDWHPQSTVESIINRIANPKIVNGVKLDRKGAIVLMHPKANTVKALPAIIDDLVNDGFSFNTLQKLITFDMTGNTTSEQ